MSQNISENDIRPKDLDDGKMKALHADLERLSLRKKEFVEVNCPACDSDRKKPFFEKYGFSFSRCEKCATVYMTPRATAEVLNDFYSNSVLYDYWNKYIFPATQEVRREKIFKPRVQKIIEICKKYSVSTDCILEVGAGFGTFCEEMLKTDFFKKVIAVEPGSALAESCRKAGIETIEDSIENIKTLTPSPNVIASFEVIEHLFSPQQFLENCYRLMPSGSVIAITCPNYNGFDISALGPDSDSIDAEHVNMFNPDSIGILFNRCGFEVMECFTPGQLDADILRGKILDGEFDVSNQPFLKTVLIDKWEEIGNKFQKFLQDNKLSSNMWIVGRKVK